MLNLIIALVITLVVTLSIDSWICSEKFNRRLVQKYVKQAHRLPKEQYDNLITWINEHVESVSVDAEVSYKELLEAMPSRYKHKLNSKKLRGIMHECGYDVLSNCFIDTDIYAIKIKNIDIN